MNSEQPAKVRIEDDEILSETDDEHVEGEHNVDEDEEEAHEEESLPVQRGFPTIDDDNVQVLESDAELTKDIDIETDYIELIHLKIHSLKDLELGKFPNLTNICLRQNLISSLNEVKNFSNKEKLVEFDLYDNRIDHISSHMNDFTNLQTLDLSFNKIKNIKNLDKLVNLENLYLIQNKISEIKNLSTLQKLILLELGGNKISLISEELTKLPNLKKLWLGKNRIKKLENLDKLTNLKVLSIQSNRITKLEGLENLINLEELYISHNKLSKIEGLDKLTKLYILDITGNFIEKLEGFETLKELTDLWASSNKIRDFENIEDALKNCTKLECVYFENNPVQLNNMTSYRRKLKLYLPKTLNKIDATYL